VSVLFAKFAYGLSVWLAHLVRAPALVHSMCARGAGSIPGQAGRLSLPSLRGR
jgi:hypothetical protein